MKENGFKLTKERSRRYLVQIITDANYANDVVLLVNTPTQAESLLHSLEQKVASAPRQRKQDNTCALIKKATSPHEVPVL